MQGLTTRADNLKIIQGGKAIKRRTGGPIGRPRTAEPRIPIRVALEPGELAALDAKPIALLPVPEHVRALPPFQRLSLAQQSQITYARQQKKSARAKLAKVDRMVHSEIVLDFRVEIWQTGETRGTATPKFYFRTESLILGANGGQNRRGKYEYDKAVDCLNNARANAANRECLWRGRKRSNLPVSGKRRRRRSDYIAPSRADARLIDKITSCDCPTDEATCPVCSKEIPRNAYALRSHFAPHVKSGLLQSGHVDELLSFLVVSKCHNDLIGIR